MRAIKVAGFALVMGALLVGEVRAEGWQWPSLNPFASMKKTSPYKVNDGKTGSWLPGWGKSTTTRRSGPTTWQRVQSAPANMFNKTKETLAPLNPFRSEPKKTSFFNGPQQQEETVGWWPSWMTSEEKSNDPPTTVSDWLAAPRPE